MAAGGEHGTKAVVAAMLANGAIAIAKFVAFLVTGASSLLAESIHSVADTGNQGLLLLGGKRAKRVDDEEHPFGYGRERYFWSFVVAIVLFMLGAVFAVYEGIHKIQHPEQLDSPIWAFGVLGFAIVVEALSFRTAIVEANKVRGRAPGGPVHPPLQVPRAAGRAARGLRRHGRPGHRLRRRHDVRASPTSRSGTASAPSPSASSSASSPSSS